MSLPLLVSAASIGLVLGIALTPEESNILNPPKSVLRSNGYKYPFTKVPRDAQIFLKQLSTMSVSSLLTDDTQYPTNTVLKASLAGDYVLLGELLPQVSLTGSLSGTYNVTGNNSPSFVLHNIGHKRILVSQEEVTNEPKAMHWYNVMPNKAILFWPNEKFYSNGIHTRTTWNAVELQDGLTDSEMASIAEEQMAKVKALNV